MLTNLIHWRGTPIGPFHRSLKGKIPRMSALSPKNLAPDLTGLKRLLHRYEGKVAFVMPITSRSGSVLGNNGDELMHRVFSKVLRVLGIAITTDSVAADLVIVPPNGALLEVYSFPDILQDRLISLGDLPLVIFPSSALFPTRDPSFMFAGRSAPTLWIMRERFSFEHLVSRWGSQLRAVGVDLQLDHDVVASGHEFAREMAGNVGHRSGLVLAARIDRESTARQMADSGRGTGDHTPNLGRTLARSTSRLLPYGRVYTFLTRAARRKLLRRTSEDLVAVVERAGFGAELEGSRRVARADISSPTYATYGEYFRLISTAEIIVTDRLHVGLPAAFMGSRVFLVEAGYHKLRGVYEQSMSHLDNVTLLSRDEA